jgi:cytochrome b561
MPATKYPVRYHTLIIILHWLMVAAIAGMFLSAWSLEYLSPQWKFTVIQWHKSLGVLILLAATARLAIRLSTISPRLPKGIVAWEKLAARLGHIALYLLMFAVPLAGWLMVSSSPYGLPTIVFGWFTWPHIPGVEMNKLINEWSYSAHELLGYALIATIGAHVLGTVKHFVKDNINLLPRITFWQSNTGDKQ